MLKMVVVLIAQTEESAMVVSRLAITSGVLKPHQIVLSSSHAQAAIAAVNKLLNVLHITLVNVEGRADYADRVP